MSCARSGSCVKSELTLATLPVEVAPQRSSSRPRPVARMAGSSRWALVSVARHWSSRMSDIETQVTRQPPPRGPGHRFGVGRRAGATGYAPGPGRERPPLSGASG